MDVDHRSVMSGNYHTLTIQTPVADPKEPTDYNNLINKPSINGVELVGDVQIDAIIKDYDKIPKAPLTNDDIDDIVGD